MGEDSKNHFDYSASPDNDSISMITTKIPPNGVKGQALVKASEKDYDVMWLKISGGGGGDCGCESIPINDIIKIMEG